MFETLGRYSSSSSKVVLKPDFALKADPKPALDPMGDCAPKSWLNCQSKVLDYFEVTLTDIVLLTAELALEALFALLDPSLEPDLELEILLSLSSLALSAFFNSIAYSPASFRPKSELIFTKNFKHSTFSGNRRWTNFLKNRIETLFL